MPAIGEDVAAIGCVPHRGCVILRAGGDACAIRRPGCGVDIGSMAAIGVDAASSGSIPDLYRFILPTGGDAFAVGRPGHIVHPIGMPGIDEVCAPPEKPPGDPATAYA